MATGAVLRLMGVSALVAGALFALTDVLSLVGTAELETGDHVRWAILAIACALGLAGLIGVFPVQVGVLGLVGCVLSFVGLLLVFGFAWGGV
ncbi:MAG: hypothetical protein R3324_06090, partial [Halobacteriales archaeon]|nr:hypothetical protein [Halobacteriales archaeon]